MIYSLSSLGVYSHELMAPLVNMVKTGCKK